MIDAEMARELNTVGLAWLIAMGLPMLLAFGAVLFDILRGR